MFARSRLLMAFCRAANRSPRGPALTAALRRVAPSLVCGGGATLLGSSLCLAGGSRTLCSTGRAPFHGLSGTMMTGGTVPFDTFAGRPVIMLNVASR